MSRFFDPIQCMNNRKNIENEWMALAPGVGPISPVVPYQAPEGYFENFPEWMARLVKAEPVLTIPGLTSHPGYQVPAGYFEGFSETMLAKVKALESGSASEETKALSPLLAALERKTPFSVPAGYFNELPANTTDGARAIDLVNEELENLSPMMSHLRTVQPYEVPAGYFESLDQTMLEKLSQPKGGKLIPMSGARKWMRYAAAAAVAGLIFIGAMKIFSGSKDTGKLPELAGISDTAIIKYLEQQNGDPVPVIAETSGNDVNFTASDMKDMLADISDDELQKYVDQQVTGETTITN